MTLINRLTFIGPGVRRHIVVSILCSIKLCQLGSQNSRLHCSKRLFLLLDLWVASTFRPDGPYGLVNVDLEDPKYIKGFNWSRKIYFRIMSKTASHWVYRLYLFQHFKRSQYLSFCCKCQTFGKHLKIWNFLIIWIDFLFNLLFVPTRDICLTWLRGFPEEQIRKGI